MNSKLQDPRITSPVPAITRQGKGAAKKYRPSLTAQQVSTILTLAKTALPLTDETMSLISTLAPFMAKIENDGIVPAYTVSNKPPANSLESLGGMITSDANSHVSKEAHWEQCYLRILEVGAAACTLETIQAAEEHRYLNDLMTPEEETAHESK